MDNIIIMNILAIDEHSWQYIMKTMKIKNYAFLVHISYRMYEEPAFTCVACDYHYDNVVMIYL